MTDLWSRKLTKKVRASYAGTVAPHGVIMVRINPQPQCRAALQALTATAPLTRQ